MIQNKDNLKNLIKELEERTGYKAFKFFNVWIAPLRPFTQREESLSFKGKTKFLNSCGVHNYTKENFSNWDYEGFYSYLASQELDTYDVFLAVINHKILTVVPGINELFEWTFDQDLDTTD